MADGWAQGVGAGRPWPGRPGGCGVPVFGAVGPGCGGAACAAASSACGTPAPWPGDFSKCGWTAGASPWPAAPPWAACQNSVRAPGRRMPEARARLPEPGAGASSRGVAGGCSRSAWTGWTSLPGEMTSCSWEMSRVVRRHGLRGAGSAAGPAVPSRAGTATACCLRWVLTAARSTAAGASARRHTRATMTTSRGSLIGVRRHQVRGSARYRPWESSSSVSLLPSMTGRVASQVSTPGGTMYRTCQGDSKGTPTTRSRTIQGTNTPRKTPICTSGSGMGSRRSYSLYSRFSMRQMFVYVGRSTPLLP